MKRVGIICVALVLIGLFLFLEPTSAYALTLTKYEELMAGDDADVEVYGVNWYGQTFTTTSAHTVTEVHIKAYREGTVTGILYAEIYETSAGVPTGAVLESGSVSIADVNTWTTVSPGATYTIPLDEELALENSTMYALVLHMEGGAATNIHWRYDNGNGEANGTEVSSTTGGVSWSTTAANDMMFEIWGYEVLEVSNARVFSGASEEGDWLVVLLYQNVYPPYFTDKDNPKQYFNLELTSADGATVLATVKCPTWEYRPGGIYLEPDDAAVLEWGSAYRVRIRGNTDQFAVPPSTYYTLTAADWYGSDLTYLEDWVRLTVTKVEEHDESDLTDEITGVGTVLNDAGATIYLTGLPGLDAVVPDVFLYTVQPITHDENTYSYTYENSLIANTGAELLSRLDDLGDTFNLSGTQMGGLLMFIMYLVCIGVVMSVGKSTASAITSIGAMVISFPVIWIGIVMGLISLSIIGVIGVLMIGLLIYLTWFRVA